MQLADLQGVGKTRLTALHAAGIDSLRDLLYAVPFRYVDMGERKAAADAHIGERQAFLLRRVGEPKLLRHGKMSRVTCLFEDESGALIGCWFNQPWMKEALMKRDKFLLFGKVDRFGRRLQLTNPSIEDEVRIMPMYRPIEGIPPKTRESLISQALDEATDACPEFLPGDVLSQYGLMDCTRALRAMHRPQSMTEVAQAQRRFAFEQILLYQIAVRSMKRIRRDGRAMDVPQDAEERYWRQMPYQPTNAQRRTLHEIALDLRKPQAMARMVQGDVGCGKTAIAFGAMAMCVQAGSQAALMAPTEILARQHFESAKALLEPMGIRCGLFLGGMKAAERRDALDAIQSGAWQVVIGTHALIGDKVRYHSLGLCVTDEQHRFGVGQRTRLLNKGGEVAPDLLVMSATPIPRSLALVMFGDLDVSVVDELPPGRTPVTTRIVPDGKRKDMYLFLRNEIEAGRQGYVVCPLVEEDEANEQQKAVESHFETLCRGPLKEIPIGLTHGRQSSQDKAAVLQAFAEGRLKALVATTVIEVGVNVPNASVMIIENAERYGLAQLHQLRGRVGRGAEKSWCFLVGKENERLKTLVSTNDGFEVARKDLELRGPGELLGTRQHGVALLPNGVDLCNTQLLHAAAECAERLATDPTCRDAAERVRERADEYLRKTLAEVSVS